MKKESNVSQGLIYILLIMGALSAVVMPVYRLYIKCSVIVGILLIICCLCRSVINNENGRLVVCTGIFFILNIIVSHFNSEAGIGATINILIFVYLHLSLKVNDISRRFIKFLSLLYLGVCLYCAFVSRGYGALHYASYMSGKNLYINPNLLAYMVCIMSFQVWTMIREYSLESKFILSIANLGFILLNIWSISNLECRSSYLAILLFFFLVYFYPSRLITKTNIILIYILLILASVLIPIIYIYMYKNGIFLNVIGGITKRTYTGREIIWNSYVENFSSVKDWIIGLGSKAEIQGFADMHNMTLSLLKNGGIVSVAIVYLYLGKQIAHCFDMKMTRQRFTYIAAVLAALVIGFFESIFLSSQFFCILVLLLYQAETMGEERNVY